MSDSNLHSFALFLGAASIVGIMLYRCARRRDPLFTSLVAVMSALSIVGRLVFAPLTAFKPSTAVIIITGMTLGADAGFLCGAFTALVSNIYFGQGIWTVFQMASWGIIGVFSGFLAKSLEKSKILLWIYGAFCGVLYSFVMDLFSVIWQDGGFNLTRFLAYTAASLPFAAMYAVSNVVFLALMYKRMSAAVRRVVDKYGLEAK